MRLTVDFSTVCSNDREINRQIATCTMVKTILTVVILLTLLGCLTGKADQKDDAAAMRSVIQTQLDAFARNDAVKAYAQASPKIRSIFPTTELFMTMVRQGYSALIAPEVVGFLDVVDDSGRPVFQVLVEGRDGRRWMAFYTMVQLDDASWRIGGCVLTKLPEESV